MKKLILFAFLISYSISAQNLYKGFNVGMTKKEAKSEFKKNKDQYISATFGGYKYRLYTQNNEYDKNGGLSMIQFSPKGYAMGMDRVTAKLYFMDLVRLLDNTGFTVDESGETLTYEFTNENNILVYDLTNQFIKSDAKYSDYCN